MLFRSEGQLSARYNAKCRGGGIVTSNRPVICYVPVKCHRYVGRTQRYQVSRAVYRLTTAMPPLFVVDRSGQVRGVQSP